MGRLKFDFHTGDEDLDLMPIVSSWVLALFAATPMPPQNVLVCWDLLLLGTPSRRELSLERCAGGRPRDRDTGSGSDDAAGNFVFGKHK